MTLKSNKIVPALKEAAKKGVDVSDALDQLTQLVETASEVRPTVTSILTAIGTKGDGEPLIVGWDTCGTCLIHVSRCACAKGPTQPNYVAKWVEEFEARLSTPVRNLESPENLLSPGEGSVSGENAIPAVQTKSTGVPSGTRSRASCKECGKAVLTGPDNANADRNDDGTWTCFSCQEGGA